jgi:hypothetical protein
MSCPIQSRIVERTSTLNDIAIGRQQAAYPSNDNDAARRRQDYNIIFFRELDLKDRRWFLSEREKHTLSSFLKRGPAIQQRNGFRFNGDEMMSVHTLIHCMCTNHNKLPGIK